MSSIINSNTLLKDHSMDHLNINPSILHRNSPCIVTALPPSARLLPSMPNTKSGACTERITKMPFPRFSNNHNWFDEPVGSHCMIFAPGFFDYWLMSTSRPLLKLRIWYAFPVFMRVQRWLNLPLRCHWINRTPPSMLASGTSSTILQRGFYKNTVLFSTLLLFSIGSNRNNWLVSFMWKFLLRKMPYKETALLVPANFIQ
jgi:hypothetical protein